MNKKSNKQKTHEAATRAAEKLSKATVDSINGWKAVAITKFHAEHPLAWRHGAEMVEAVADLECAYLAILEMMERHFDEMDSFNRPSPVNN